MSGKPDISLQPGAGAGGQTFGVARPADEGLRVLWELGLVGSIWFAGFMSELKV